MDINEQHFCLCEAHAGIKLLGSCILANLRIKQFHGCSLITKCAATAQSINRWLIDDSALAVDKNDGVFENRWLIDEYKRFFMYPVAIRTGPVHRLVFAIHTGF